ncbi:hypothetical protein C8J57DRAFT_1361962 [Mycena rebaudengoi]|nr:hypothetical protein C8J57DRAFT_1364420 [Mycena rebaudengoi]KAJ7245456.1 hypothetical protein C8J57DRAFT_1361962 [Mycena rebaudengoi]
MQEHNVWSRMGVVIMKKSLPFFKGYIQLGEVLSGLTQWTPYIHHKPSHWITIYSQLYTDYQEELQSSYLSVLERIWGVKYTGTYQFTKDAEKALAWTLIALSIVWEGFNFSGQQTLEDFYLLIRCTISTAFKSHNPYKQYSWAGLARTHISPNFRATFSTGLGDALIQAAKNTDDVISQTPTQIENQLDLDNSLEEKIQVLQQVTTILGEMGQALKLESEGEQVDRGEERANIYWNNLRAHFEEQVNKLEKSLKETPGTAKISH